MNPWFIVIENLAVGVVAFLLGYLLKRYLVETHLRAARDEVERLLAEAHSQAQKELLEAKEKSIQLRNEAEAESERRRRELQKQEERLQQRQEYLERRLDQLENRERRLNQRQSQLDKQRNEIEKLLGERIKELERVSQMTQEEARAELLRIVEASARQDMARVIREVEAEIKREADRRAREIIATAIQRCASDQVAETTVSLVPLPNDEMKGRIIGRGGRNIRALEIATGVDLVVDDTPEAVLVSSFDPIRREIASQSLHKLILDGRIHPARIEKIVQKTQEEIEAAIREDGERVAYQVGVPGLHPELLRLLGRLRYRTSYGQNVQLHSIETATLAAIMAAELGADVQLAKAGGLLHDIGKAVDHETDGAHAAIGAEIARRLDLSPKLVNCIAAHHGEEEPICLEAILVEAADAISGARPGARRESLEQYVKRVRALEEVANTFRGVSQSYAIQAGREIRIIVKPEEVDDLAIIQLSKDIAKKVEESLEYPGQIKVTVIRETRAVEYAR